MSDEENARRRATARAMWTQQLTPEQVANQRTLKDDNDQMREALQRAMDCRP